MRGAEKRRARLEVLYQFDLSVVAEHLPDVPKTSHTRYDATKNHLSVASGLVPDEGFVASGHTCPVEFYSTGVPDVPKTSYTRYDATKNHLSVASGLVPDEGFRKDKIFLSDLCGKTKGFPAIAGCDEAGRGALAGPAIVACVHLPIDNFVLSGHLPDGLLPLLGVDDSKRLTPKRRAALFPRIREVGSVGIGWASPAEIDRIGIVPALHNAACRAYTTLGITPALVLLDRGLSLVGFTAEDGKYPPELSFTKGDSRSLHIAAASIIAKVTRDRLMVELDQRVPGYGFGEHKGYGTRAHRAAINRLGPSPIHRRSFKVRGVISDA